jgi:hypothetical protein
MANFFEDNKDLKFILSTLDLSEAVDRLAGARARHLGTGKLYPPRNNHSRCGSRK